MSLRFSPNDRVMVIAPHPDDESLATGGLIISARKAGAAVRILFATNGDNNPWPQRWVEKRWRIGTSERQRWGSRRNSEARAAVESLGLPSDAARFLNFPDQGITGKLLHDDQEALQRLRQELMEFAPTLLVIPSPHDLHPDHNGLYVLFQVALRGVALPELKQLHFIVHCRRPDLVPGRMELNLNDSDLQIKREAILRHHTQMVLSEKRFLAYAKPKELYYEARPMPSAMDHHHVRDARFIKGALTLTIALPPRRWKGTSLYIAAESQQSGSIRWAMRLPSTTSKVALRSTVDKSIARHGTVRIVGRLAIVKIPVAPLMPLQRIFVKLHRRMIFLDEAGWREIPVPVC